MTIDERLEKLVERHEALAQSVELMAIGNRVTETLVREMVKGINDLVSVVRNHEQRLGKLES
jgi:hypothetical protein